MKYRIDHAEGKSDFIEGRDDLLKVLKKSARRDITDIRKIYENGISDSVMDKYEPIIERNKAENAFFRKRTEDDCQR